MIHEKRSSRKRDEGADAAKADRPRGLPEARPARCQAPRILGTLCGWFIPPGETLCALHKHSDKTRQCVTIAKDGQRCRAWAIDHGPHCFEHDPELEGALRAIEAFRLGQRHQQVLRDLRAARMEAALAPLATASPATLLAMIRALLDQLGVVAETPEAIIASVAGGENGTGHGPSTGGWSNSGCAADR